MDSLQEMFPTLSLAVIQSAFTKGGDSIEDAIEVLLQISDSEPAQTVGQQEESAFLSPTVVPHSSTQNWSQHLYGRSYPYTTEWSEGTAPSYPGTYGFQSGYSSYSQAHPHGRSVGGGASGYGDVYPSRYVNSSGGHMAYGYSEQQLWSSGVLGVGQQEVEASSLLDTPSSSGESSVTSSPLHTPQVPAVSYSKACTASPKGTRRTPKAATTPPTKTRVNKQKKKIIIMRGLPGSGKSTLARDLRGRTGVICSTDDFFFQNGQYVYDPSKLGENHDKNKKKVQEAMEAGTTPVIVDNTNLSCREMEPYVSLGVQYGYSIEFREPNTRWRRMPNELARRNTHGVPEYKIRSMMDRFEKRVTVESVLAYAPSPSRHESKEGMQSSQAALPSLQIQQPLPQQEQQQPPLLNPGCQQAGHGGLPSQSEIVTRGEPTLPVRETECSTQRPWEQESEDRDSMRFLQIIQGRTTATAGTVEDHSSPHSSSQYLTASEQSLPSDLVDYYGFTVDASTGTNPPACHTERMHYTEDCPKAQSDVVSSSAGNQMPVFSSAPAVQPLGGQYPFLQDSPEYRDPKPGSTQSNAEDATQSDVSEGLSQDEPPILTVPPERQEDIAPPLGEDFVGDPASFPAQSQGRVDVSYWGTMGTTTGDVTEVSNNKESNTAPSLAGLDLELDLEGELDEGEMDNDHAITPQLVDTAEGSVGGVLSRMADMTLSNTQAPCLSTGEVPRDTLMQPVAVDPVLQPVQSLTSDVLLFLNDCFPEHSEAFLLQCWESSNLDIDACMDMVLTSSFKDSDDEEAPKNFPTEYDMDKMPQLPVPKSVAQVKQDSPPSHHSSNTSGSSSFGVPQAAEDRDLSAPTPQALTDEEYARQLQAEYDKETVPPSQTVPLPQPTLEQPMVEQPRGPLAGKGKVPETTTEDEYLVRQYGEDEGFVLRLPRLLAYKLQDMYGPVSQHTEGDDLSNEDLAVLLSEQVAKSLYNLWVKTLKAKQDEIAVQRDLQRQKKQDTSAGHCQEVPPSPPRAAHTRSSSKKHSHRRHRKRKFVPLNHSLSERSTVARQGKGAQPGGGTVVRGTSLLEIMDEQQAQEMGAGQYSAIVDQWLDADRAAWLQVNDLYRKHSSVPKEVIDRYLVQTGMNISNVDSYLCYLAEPNTVSVFKKSQNPTPAVSVKDKPDSTSSRPSDDCSDGGVYQEYKNPTYQDYRAEAQLQARLRHEAFQKAAAAWRANKRDLASFYAAQGRKHSEQMQDANYRAAENIYQKNSQFRGKHSVDLHGLHVTEALSILEEKLGQVRGHQIEIITGQGSHSQGGVPRLKRAVVNLLNTKGLPYDIPSHNPGVIMVDLSRWRRRR